MKFPHLPSFDLFDWDGPEGLKLLDLLKSQDDFSRVDAYCKDLHGQEAGRKRDSEGELEWDECEVIKNADLSQDLD
jgi:hypothetical protein